MTLKRQSVGQGSTQATAVGTSSGSPPPPFQAWASNDSDALVRTNPAAPELSRGLPCSRNKERRDVCTDYSVV